MNTAELHNWATLYLFFTNTRFALKSASPETLDDDSMAGLRYAFRFVPFGRFIRAIKPDHPFIDAQLYKTLLDAHHSSFNPQTSETLFEPYGGFEAVGQLLVKALPQDLVPHFSYLFSR